MISNLYFIFCYIYTKVRTQNSKYWFSLSTTFNFQDVITVYSDRAKGTNRRVRTRRALTLFNDIPLSTRRALSPYTLYSDSALLVFKGNHWIAIILFWLSTDEIWISLFTRHLCVCIWRNKLPRCVDHPYIVTEAHTPHDESLSFG